MLRPDHKIPWGAMAGCLALMLGCDLIGPRYTVQAPTILKIQPQSAVLTTGRRMTFGHRITSAFGTQVTWDVLEADGGSVDALGNYQSPRRSGTFHVRVASVADAAQSATAVVKVVEAPKGPITAPDMVESGASGLWASVPFQSGASYAWTIVCFRQACVTA